MSTQDTASADALRGTANDLYWTSAETVDQLARQLGISRNAMYSSVRPLPAGASCVHCDEPLLFTNRTARAARSAFCPVCEIQVTMSEAGTGAEAATGAGNGLAAAQSASETITDRLSHWKEELTQVPAERAAIIGGAAALGVAVGAAAAKALRKR